MLIFDRLQEADLNTKVIYMIDNSFAATCGHKTNIEITLFSEE